MPSPTEITPAQLVRLIGLPGSPAIVDVRPIGGVAYDMRIPGTFPRDPHDVGGWASDFAGKPVVVVCENGGASSQGIAALLRTCGIAAETLAGGYSAWQAAAHPTIKTGKLPALDAKGRTVWVTRQRPKIDRIACPWLIRRFVDPNAVMLFVPAGDVVAVAERHGGAPFDIDDVFWSHRGETCTFDAMLDEFGLEIAPLRRLATIVRAADTARLDLAPEAAGLLAVSLGFSRMYRDDLTQLAAAMSIYDGFYRWCRDATDETHNWPASKPQA
ncbi:MAG: chromate resistance protein [Hyphomicrobiaceae bacterium]|nr:chromate resistance protein [Hyphomicrobiaceae bacterium]